MLQQPTIERLYALRLAVMAAAWQQQQTDTKIASLTFDERFAFLVDAEFIARQNKRVAMMLKQAELRFDNACIEDVEASGPRGLDPAILHQLAACTWIGGVPSAALHKGKKSCRRQQKACERRAAG